MTDSASPELGPERLILAAAAAALSVGVIVWSGASLAALAAGERFEAGLPSALRASLRLPREWRDPRMAWGRPAERDVLPGPVLYWFATLTVAVVVASVGVLVMRTWRATRTRGRVRLGVETRARLRHDPRSGTADRSASGAVGTIRPRSCSRSARRNRRSAGVGLGWSPSPCELSAG